MAKNDEISSIESDLEATRARTEATIDALQRKLQPRAVVDEATRFFRGTDSGKYAEDVTRNALAQARENPVPLLLMGIGAALLATKRPGRTTYVNETTAYGLGADTDAEVFADDYAAQQAELDALYDAEWEETHRVIGSSEAIDRTYTRLDDEDEDTYQNRLYEARGRAFEIERHDDEDDKSFRQRIDERLHRAKSKAGEYKTRAGDYRRRQTEKASGLYQRAGDRTSAFYGDAKSRAGGLYGSTRQHASDFAQGTQARAGRFADSTKQHASDLAHGTQDAARRSVHATTDFYEERPLVAAIAAVAAGVIAGSFFSVTGNERRALRPVSDQLGDAAKRLNEAANAKIAEYAHRVQEFAERTEERVDDVAANDVGSNEVSDAETDTTGYTPSSQPTGASS
ncbi:DUF3618 domain-containing protein [Parvularcula dongshanensis]|uniref:ElaB/YqjD/DUF883 family membrane-anchored ribosome-binding protein n=1 Tax=Parvularcula dongshanensis TaxID=1173995 RepID=A0A840I202_9PROT|nr:DUF3618 domain-containing protein [Parvularcula dongshanensis]MBB4658365.1 ElaB/YqjD/DUF883 family membrane-anchored ribosome-binding protein [Parvularcula dongshanensis]